jgi:hypothetical protein
VGRAARGGTAWLTSCWRVDLRPRWSSLRIAGVQGGHRFSAAQPIAYGLLDGRLRPGDSFCQRALFDVPAEALRGETQLWLSLGDLAPVPSSAKLLVE